MHSDRRSNERRSQTVPTAPDRRRTERRQRDRRQASRVPLDLWVEEEKGNELYFRRTGNVSIGGIYFEQSIPHPLGTKLKLRISLPGTLTVIEAAGEIVNTPQAKDGLGMGMRFTEMTQEAVAALQRFLDENAA